MSSWRLFFALVVVGVSASAATFIVPTDRAMVQRAHAIVVAQVVSSYPRLTPGGAIETITALSVQEVIKGAVLAQTIEVHEPGGSLNGLATWIPGVPRFGTGERVLLFLTLTPRRTWAATDIALGKFSFVTDVRARELAMRAEGDVAEWETNGVPHSEPRRLAERFLEYLRIEAGGGTGVVDYLVPDEPPRRHPAALAKPPALIPAPLSFNPTSYSADVQNCPGSNCGNGLGARWSSFPATFYVQPGTSSTAVSASTAALSAWSNTSISGVRYTYGGIDPCSPNCHKSGFVGTDGFNAILWERDLSAYGIPAFLCTSAGVAGTLGIGGVTSASGTHTGPNGETFYTNAEVDVEMNQGVLACVGAVFTSGDLSTAVAHEVGHTLGFRHADQTRAGDPSIPCEEDPSLECAGTLAHPSSAIMKSFVPMGLNGALQTWDQHAAAAVYPLPAGSPPAAPASVVATATTSTTVRIAWSAASGAASYQVFRSGSSQPIGISNTTLYDDTTASPNTAYLYRVQAVNTYGNSPDSATDLATTVIFTDPVICLGFNNPADPPSCSGAPPTRIRAVYVGELTTTINAVCTLAGTSTIPGSPPGVNVRIGAGYFNSMRSALNAARQQLTLSAVTYADPPPQLGTRIRRTHIVDLRTGVQ